MLSCGSCAENETKKSLENHLSSRTHALVVLERGSCGLDDVWNLFQLWDSHLANDFELQKLSKSQWSGWTLSSCPEGGLVETTLWVGQLKVPVVKFLFYKSRVPRRCHTLRKYPWAKATIVDPMEFMFLGRCQHILSKMRVLKADLGGLKMILGSTQ